jgi:uncharacterized protein YjbI with pentapeptide repeats
LAIVSAIRLYRLGMGTLRGQDRLAFTWKAVVRRRDTLTGILWAALSVVVLIVISLGSVFGIPAQPGTISFNNPRTWAPRVLHRIGSSSFAELTNADVSLKPADWTGKDDQELDRVKGAVITGKNLRYINAEYAFLVNARMRSSDLRGADLMAADLRQADLMEANLTGATLVLAHLEKAILSGVLLDNANLLQAHLNGADLSGVQLKFAYLDVADLSEADLEGADLTECRLVFTKLRYTDLRHTKGLTNTQIKLSTDWSMAFFDSDMLEQLGLPQDHNKKLELERKSEEQQKEKSSAARASQIIVPAKANPRKSHD